MNNTGDLDAIDQLKGTTKLNKAMKTTKLILSTIIAFSFLMLSCNEPPGVEPRIPIPPPEENLSFRSTVYFYQQQNVINSERINDAVRTKLKSVGASGISKLNSFHIELSHVAYKSDIKDMILIEDGEMIIRGSNGDQLFGKYHGFGNVNSNPGELKLVISITDGTGSLSGMTGYLSGYCKNYGLDHRLGEIKFSGHFLQKDLPI